MTDKKEILDRLFVVFTLILMSVIVLSNLTGILPYDVNWVLSAFQESMVEAISGFAYSFEEPYNILPFIFQTFIITSGVAIYFFTLIFTLVLVIAFVLEKILKSSNKRMGKNS